LRDIPEPEPPNKGEHYQIPYTGPGATGLGKLLKTIIHPSPNLKIYAASIAPAGLRTAAEVADGVLPFLMSPEQGRAEDARRFRHRALRARPHGRRRGGLPR
jgi:alkanesulfonate monooxygenase SsuD/methylene tetrahydromethanopterin reductase-like flavin-dependent oxidoreductase (luciferase family)